MMSSRSMMCMAMPVMPMMAMARKAWSCGSRVMKMDAWQGSDCARGDRTRGPADAAAGRAPKNLVETAREAGSFGSLLGALKAAGLDSALEMGGPFTVFAPSDEAFGKLPSEMLQGLLSKPEELAKVLRYHVVRGRLTTTDLASVASVRTLEGPTLILDLAQGGRVGAARVVKADIACANGVIHVIDSVLLPE